MDFAYLIVAALSAWGITICYQIAVEKRAAAGKPLVCQIGFDCDAVVRSRYSKLFGIPLEYLGLAYYTIAFLAYAAIVALAGFMSPEVRLYASFILTGLSGAAFLLSCYLTFVQAFYIKEWCSWCLTSATISTLSFLTVAITTWASGVSFVPILEQWHAAISLLHVAGFALGVAGATFSVVFFFRFVRDFKIDPEERSILDMVSQVIWMGLFLVIISGVGLFITDQESSLQSSAFLLKVLAIGVITASGAVLNLVVAPRMVDMVFDHTLNVAHARLLRRLSFALGAITTASWYASLAANAVPDSLSFWPLAAIYIALLVLLVIGSLILEDLLCKKSARMR